MKINSLSIHLIDFLYSLCKKNRKRSGNFNTRNMKQTKFGVLVAILAICGTITLTSCSDDSDNVNPDQPVVLNCTKPDYLKAGDKVALISPSYFTPMENVEKTADVLRSWGLEPVIGPNVGKVVDGRYAGTVAERVSDIRWALSDPEIKAIICNRGGYGTI